MPMVKIIWFQSLAILDSYLIVREKKLWRKNKNTLLLLLMAYMHVDNYSLWFIIQFANDY